MRFVADVAPLDSSAFGDDPIPTPEPTPEPEIDVIECLRCGRPLINHERRADGMGIWCRNIKPHRRRIRFIRVEADGTRVYTIYSLTKAGTDSRYQVSVNFEDGTFHCDCPDHTYRGSSCKHLRRVCDHERRRRFQSVSES